MAAPDTTPAAPRATTAGSLRKAAAPHLLPEGTREGRRVFEPVHFTPLLVIVAASVADLLTPHLQFNRLLGAAPALAAAMWPVAGTLATGLLAVISELALALAGHSMGQTQTLFTLLAITAITLAAAYASHVRQHRESTLAEVRTVAEVAQRVLLRPPPQHLGHLDIEVLYQAAAAHARIGGDFYGAARTPHGVRLIIGDVRGKGLGAVEAASVMLGAFRVHVRDAPDLPYLAGRLEASMNDYCEEVPGDDAPERFITVVLAEIPDGQPVARLVNCGHPAPLVVHGGDVREVDSSAPSPPINMAALLGAHYRVDTVPFAVDDRLLLYTDGVSESRDATGAFYPLAQRVSRWTSATPRQLLDHLRHDLLAYVCGVRDDDVAAMAVRRVAPDAPRD